MWRGSALPPFIRLQTCRGVFTYTTFRLIPGASPSLFLAPEDDHTNEVGFIVVILIIIYIMNRIKTSTSLLKRMMTSLNALKRYQLSLLSN